jgi:hypothetical protein
MLRTRRLLRAVKHLTTLLACVFSFGIQAQRKATTEDGQLILVYDDGTWKSGVELEINKDPYPMERPPFNGKVLSAPGKSKVFTLTQLSATKNNITDDAEWFTKNDLALPEYEVPNAFRSIAGNVPDKTPKSWNRQLLVRAIKGEKHNCFVYGKDFASGFLLLVTNNKMDSVLHFLDFGNYVLSPEYVRADLEFIEQRINWAVIEDSILYVAHAHSTYAASSKNMNAYITAINLKNYKIIWRSKPMANNASNFEIYGDMIICGYGFTAEPDFLYSLDKRTGAIVQTLPLKSGPSYIILKGEKVFVRTYNMDYVFKIK